MLQTSVKVTTYTKIQSERTLDTVTYYVSHHRLEPLTVSVTEGVQVIAAVIPVTIFVSCGLEHRCLLLIQTCTR